MKISRVFARASHETFRIKPIAELLSRYMGSGTGWADPYARISRRAEYVNDLDPSCGCEYKMDAVDFAASLKGPLVGVLFDPPYSYRQISEHYRAIKKTVTQKDTSYNFYRRVMNALAPKVFVGGWAISFGWNSNGFGKCVGFQIVEILIVAHGLHHNDTICTVEQKVREI